MEREYKITNIKLILITALFLVISGNYAFFNNVLIAYPPNLNNSAFLGSLFIFFTCINIILFTLVCFNRTTKPILIIVLIISSFAAYFMNTYNVIIDDSMIDNILKTDANETLDLFSFKQVIYFLLLGVLPAVFVYKVTIIRVSFRKAILSNLMLLLGASCVSVALILSLSSFYASFFREHKALRYYANPSYYIYSTVKYVHGLFGSGVTTVEEMGLDANIPPSDVQRELVIFVVGETARADHFSLNGYHKKTNPLLEKENVVSFGNVLSCGTSTAHSVPCMFSIYGHSDYTKNKGESTENVLDILLHAGVNVLWLDNNSSSKGVANRVDYQDYKSPEINPVCDVECRDEGMLVNLQSYVDAHPTGDILIVLHQMGNHGPAYFKRYPKKFEKFTPTCQNNQLEECTKAEINNAYDNAILYTDYFLSKTIKFLKNNDQKFEAVLFYVSDHGESLGENNMYLHGLPYVIAPYEQIHVPMLMWFSDHLIGSEIDFKQLVKQKNRKLSHDNVFHTLLGLMEIDSELYDENMDIVDHDHENDS